MRALALVILIILIGSVGSFFSVETLDEDDLKQSRVFRLNLLLDEAHALFKKKRLPDTESEDYLEYIFENTFVIFEKFGGLLALDFLNEAILNYKAQGQTLTPIYDANIRLIKIYLEAGNPPSDTFEVVQKVKLEYKRAFSEDRPSLLFWPAITSAKVLRRAGQYEAAIHELENGYEFFELKQPDLGLEVLKYYFEKFILLSLLRRENEALEALAQYENLVEIANLPVPYNRLIHAFKSYFIEPGVNRDDTRLSHCLLDFGPGHYTQEAVNFWLERSGYISSK